MKAHEVTAVNIWETSLPSQVVNKANQLNLNKDIYALFAKRRTYYVQHEDEAGHRYLSVRVVDTMANGPFFDFLGLLLVDKGTEDYFLCRDGFEYLKKLDENRFRKALLQVVPQAKDKFVLELVEYNWSTWDRFYFDDPKLGSVKLIPFGAPLKGIEHAWDIVVRPYVNEEEAKQFKTKTPGYVCIDHLFLPEEELAKPVVLTDISIATMLYGGVGVTDYVLVNINAIPNLKEAGLQGKFPEFLRFVNSFLEAYKSSSLALPSPCYVQDELVIYEAHEAPQDPDATLPELDDRRSWLPPSVEEILEGLPAQIYKEEQVYVIE